MKCDGGAVQGLCVLRATASRAACAPSATDPLGDGVCAGQGRCAADAMCQGATADLLRDAGGLPKISGLAIFNLANFFNMRDSLRQQVIDLSQLVAVLKSTEALKSLSARTVLTFDLTKLGYIGQSLGGIQGTLFNSVSTDTTNVVLNVPGGAWTTLVKDTVSFAPIRVSLLAGLAAQGLMPGTPAFDQFFGTMQWILDPADPANMGYRVTHPVVANANRKAFIQFIQGDEAVPNSATLALLASANRSYVPTPPKFGCVAPLFCYEFTEAGDAFDATSAPGASRHGFLLKPPSATAGGLALTTKAQTQAATFLATGTLP